LAVTPLENSPSRIGLPLEGMSISTQWQKLTRGSEAGMVRPSLLTSSAFEGTSGSWQMITTDWLPAGSSDQASCGLRFWPSLTRLAASGMQNAQCSGIAPPSAKLSLENFMARL
jgi:hypothetical protein